jgi:2-haloalkanoic acid dehalogenase type II
LIEEADGADDWYIVTQRVVAHKIAAIMGYKAVFLDYYGTLVQEDEAILNQIIQLIADHSPIAPTTAQVGRRWWEQMVTMCRAAHGSDFQTQRGVEVESLRRVLHEFSAPYDALALTEPIFAHWQKPGAYPDAVEFVRQLHVPACIVSNVDDADLHSAMDVQGWIFPHVVTSEQCRAYKPRPEMFTAALKQMGLQPGDVLHVGDSPSSDVEGARQMGIDVAWINRHGRPAPASLPTYSVTDLRQILPLIERSPLNDAQHRKA